jgi:hypothetical protein
MTKIRKLRKAGWSDIKAQIARFDRDALIQLVHELYGASKENQAFLHTRFDSGTDVLEPYKAKLKRFLNPEFVRTDHDISVSRALSVLSDYKKASGKPEAHLELMVFYCEQAAEFSENLGMEGRSWFSSLVRVFAEALNLSDSIPRKQRHSYIIRLDRVREVCQHFGWFVGYEMDNIWAQHELQR